jgi:hypothetical protein
MRVTCLSMLLLIAAPAAAQRGESDAVDDRPQLPAPAPEAKPGQVAKSTVGQVGKRQTREDVAKVVAPMARINSRIQNRVQSRIRNRIDRNYDPTANASSPFEVASEQVRVGGPKR